MPRMGKNHRFRGDPQGGSSELRPGGRLGVGYFWDVEFDVGILHTPLWDSSKDHLQLENGTATT